MGTGYHNLRSLGCILYFQNVYFHTLGRLKFLAFDLLVLGQQSVYLTEVDADVASYIALYHTGNHIVLFLEVLIKQNFTLFLTDLLKNDVFGILGCNTAELFGFDFYRNDVAEFIAGVCTFCIGKGDLHDRILYQINNGFLCYDFEITSLGVDAYLYIICFAKMVFTGLDQRLLNCLKQGIFADILLFLKNFKGLH